MIEHACAIRAPHLEGCDQSEHGSVACCDAGSGFLEHLSCIMWHEPLATREATPDETSSS